MHYLTANIYVKISVITASEDIFMVNVMRDVIGFCSVVTSVPILVNLIITIAFINLTFIKRIIKFKGAKQCKPCVERCQNKCPHSSCNLKCSDPCTPCREKCNYRCEHTKCSKLCNEICDREPCEQPCKLLIKKCKHPCLGLCGNYFRKNSLI
jgi:hypothetical protein